MKQHQKPEQLTPIQYRELALAALVDERTLQRALRGEPIRDLSRERIRRLFDARGLLHLLPQTASRGAA